MKKKITHISLLFVSAGAITSAILFIFTSCAPPAGSFAGNPSGTSSTSSNPYQGYVLISSSANKTVQLYTPEMVFVRTVLTLNSTDSPVSLAKYDSTHILVAIEGGASGQDRVINVNLDSSNDYNAIIQDSVNFTGTVKGMTRLSGGDIIASDLAVAALSLERYIPSTISYTALASRLAIGWPLATSQATTTQIRPGPSNTYTVCSNGASDLIRTYNNSGTQLGSATALAPVPSLGAAHDVQGCIFDPSDRVAALYNGATDSLRVYTTNTLAAISWTYSDLTKFANPQALAVRPNGNFLVLEFATPLDFVVEVSSTGSYVGSYTPTGVNTGTDILVMP